MLTRRSFLTRLAMALAASALFEVTWPRRLARPRDVLVEFEETGEVFGQVFRSCNWRTVARVPHPDDDWLGFERALSAAGWGEGAEWRVL